MAKRKCDVEPVSRQVISNKLLVALDEGDKVAVVLSSDDLSMLIDVLREAKVRTEKQEQFRRDLEQLRREAFPELFKETSDG